MSGYGVIFDRALARYNALQAVREVGGSIERLHDYSGSIFEDDAKRAVLTRDDLRKITRACRAFEVAMAPLIDDIEGRAEARSAADTVTTE